MTLEGADGDTLHGVVAGIQSETALVLAPALGGTSDMAELCGIARARGPPTELLPSATTSAARGNLAVQRH